MSEISSAIMGTVNLYLRGKYAAAQSAIAAMGAKFIHPIEPECPKNPVTIRNTTDAITRRSAGIIPQNLSGRCDMQREDGRDIARRCLPKTFGTARRRYLLRRGERFVEPRFARSEERRVGKEGRCG